MCAVNILQRNILKFFELENICFKIRNSLNNSFEIYIVMNNKHLCFFRICSTLETTFLKSGKTACYYICFEHRMRKLLMVSTFY